MALTAHSTERTPQIPLTLSASDPELKIVADRARAGGLEQAIVYGDGTVFRDGVAQFDGGPGLVGQVLATLETAGFTSMPESFPRGPHWAPHHLSVRTSSGVKEIHQVWHGEESARFASLVRRILTLTVPPGEGSVTVTDLADGLRKVASGDLAPQAVGLLVVRQSDGAARSARGWLLRLDDAHLMRGRIAGGRHETGTEVRLSPERIRELAARIGALGVERLPANLFALEYTQVEVRVLGLKRDVLARPFRGLTAQTHGENQERFDRLFELLERLSDESGAP